MLTPGWACSSAFSLVMVAGPSPRNASGAIQAFSRCAWSGQSSAWLLTLLAVVDGGLSLPSRTPRSLGGAPWKRPSWAANRASAANAATPAPSHLQILMTTPPDRPSSEAGNGVIVATLSCSLRG